jgi:hypothetical protein
MTDLLVPFVLWLFMGGLSLGRAMMGRMFDVRGGVERVRR